MSPYQSQIARRGQTAGIALAGAGVFHWLGLPLPFLLGPMFACLLCALGGARLEGMGVIGTVFRTILGVAAGASISPDVVSRAPEMALSLAMIPLFILVIGVTSYPLLRRVFRFDRVTSYYAAMPGGLQDIVVYGEEAGANLRVLSLVHATRILLLVSLAPVLLSLIWNVDLTTRPGRPAAEIPPVEIALMVLAGLGGWRIALRLKIFGASIIGPMIFAAVLSLAGLIHNRPPAEMIWACQFFIGIAVGAKYTGVTLAELRWTVLAGVVNSLLLGAISLAFIEFVARAGIAPGLEAFLAFLPGGQGEMVVLAIIAGADLTYIVLHHIFRVILVVTCAPLVFRLFPDDDPPPS
ncbi:AbrB family transcriptional regulator [Tropicimonas sp. TH_r6]|uniref:AbrB family transcriptional regulator n=1 Tax=Tropicimonas sp. TH_r6 TaxID=3082085 RepID=UPI002954C7D6|nr:AbrB family transcriptional regulator [Tropicimonas sp. TH_r6]MDV7142059.1 AbrB family transcriptional regulator [Tropicimonas sp. TH_r6]